MIDALRVAPQQGKAEEKEQEAAGGTEEGDPLPQYALANGKRAPQEHPDTNYHDERAQGHLDHVICGQDQRICVGYKIGAKVCPIVFRYICSPI